jgi:phage tail sheath protein FI
MAETLVSPGVLTRENDQSFITQQPVVVGAAIVGPTVKGPVEIPTVVTSYSDYQNRFGTTFMSGSSASDEQVYTFLTSVAAYNYFQNGGESLLVTRVVSGSATAWDYATAEVSGSNGTGSFQLEALDKGAIFNNSGSVNLITGGSGSLVSGSVDNIRWEIATASTSSGTFSLLIRRGDDNNNNKVALETWNNLSLDPTQPNYIARVIGNQTFTYNSTENYIQVSGDFPNASRYVRVSYVNNTPNYFDNAGIAKTQYTGAIPVVGSGSYGGTFAGGTGTIIPTTSDYGAGRYYNNIGGDTAGSNTQGLKGDDYDGMLNLLSNQDDYRFNVLLTPGLIDVYQTSQITTAINNTQVRGDSIYVYDTVQYGASLNSVVSQASARDSSYAATYWPWLRTIDPDSGNFVWAPASTMIGGVYAFTDASSEPWFAPAGINRGGLSTVITAERKLSQGNRDTLYQGNVNPIATFPGQGVVVYGQKTLQKQSSALDRVNVRRLLIALKSYIGQVAQNLVFEQNTAATRNAFLSQVNPYLETVQQRQGLYAYRVVMDDSNNTPDVIDRNQMVGAIYLQPTKTAEFIILDFNVLPTGATFPA